MRRSKYAGAPTLPIARGYASAALDLLAAGSGLLPRDVAWDDYSENEITHRLAQTMKVIQRRGSDIVRFNFQCTHLVEDGSHQICEIDFKFEWFEYPHPAEYNRYLAAEAKKIRGTGDSWAGRYVMQGVVDFTVAKYGKGHNLGIMVGYIVAGPCDVAVQRVKQAMSEHKIDTREVSPMAPNSSLCAHTRTSHSIHRQSITNRDITLVHLFIDLS